MINTMTGPDHYLRAQELLEEAATAPDLSGTELARAQVHATLALAAATALGASYDRGEGVAAMDSADQTAWKLIAGTKTSRR